MQVPWLLLYLSLACANALELGLAFEYEKEEFERVYAAIVSLCLSHGIITLGSVIHHTPTAQPHKCILIFMRLVLLFFTIEQWYVITIRIIKGYDSPDELM